MFSMPGHTEILVIVLVVLLLFGGKKIPELARGLGRGIKEFKDGMKDAGSEVKKLDDNTEKKETPEK